MFEFEWDPAKAASNVGKHGLSFDEAATVFADAHLMSKSDDEHGGFEQRWVSLGRSNKQELLVVVHTYRERCDATAVRIISARHAKPRERRNYEMRP